MLQVLHIDNNRLYNFPKARPILISKSLKIFTCNGCGITEIHMETLSKLPHLTTLHLQMNSISHMHELSFAETSQLHFINLESNNLTKPPLSILTEGTVLEELCLGGNPIEWTFESYEFYYKLSHNSCSIAVQTVATTTSTTPYLTTEKTDEIDNIAMAEVVNPTLLDALIATYLLVCVILESLLFAAISLYLARIVQTKSKDFDYSTSVINPSDIYKIN
uniref:LRRNT domain-containing protein n=1 Tax=Phlebotomus papatasi TaxID=29031 RepID=A0A1B0DBP8_PHLPP